MTIDSPVCVYAHGLLCLVSPSPVINQINFRGSQHKEAASSFLSAVHVPLLLSNKKTSPPRSTRNDSVKRGEDVIEWGERKSCNNRNEKKCATGNHSSSGFMSNNNGSTIGGICNLYESMAALAVSLSEIENFVAKNAIDNELQLQLRRDWKNVALIFDRMFFIIYVLIIAISVSFLFPRPI